MQSHKTIIVIGSKNELDKFFLKNAGMRTNHLEMEYKNENYYWRGFSIDRAIMEYSEKDNPFSFVYLNDKDQYGFDTNYRNPSTIALSALKNDDCKILLNQMLEISNQKANKHIILNSTSVMNSYFKTSELEKSKKARMKEIANLPKNIYLYGTEDELVTFFKNNFSFMPFISFIQTKHNNVNYQFSKSTWQFKNTETFAQTYACVYFNAEVQDGIARKEYGYQCPAIRALPEENIHDLLEEMITIRKNIFYGAPSLFYTVINSEYSTSRFSILPKEIISNISEKYFALKCRDVFFSPKAEKKEMLITNNLTRPGWGQV